MKSGARQWLKRLQAPLRVARPEPAEQAQRIAALQRNVILPARLITVGVVLYYLYNSPWLGVAVNTYGVMFETIQNVFAGYALFIVAATVLFYVVRRLPPMAVQWLVFAVGLADGVFLGGLTMLTDGFDSNLYWVYPGLIVLNAISIPLATPQIVLNLLLCIFFLIAGLIQSSAPLELSVPGHLPRKSAKLAADSITNLTTVVACLKSPEPVARILWEKLSEPTRAKISSTNLTATEETEAKKALAEELDQIFYPAIRYFVDRSAAPDLPETAASHSILQVAVLVLLSFCCYGVQALFAGQSQAEEEQKQFVSVTEQLRSAGRLSAEFAHQIKNPLAIINNVTFSLQ